jgi:hypothetical protein
MASGYWSPLAVATLDGPTLSTAATTSASCLPTTAYYTFPPNALQLGSMLRVTAQGRISNVVTTPGTARLAIMLGGTAIFDSGALALNAVAKTTLPWWFDALLTCRVQGASGQFFGFGRLHSEAIVGSGLASAGGGGSLLSSVSGGPETAPALGTATNLTVANLFDCFFTQTVTTGSFTVHNFVMESGAVALG